MDGIDGLIIMQVAVIILNHIYQWHMPWYLVFLPAFAIFFFFVLVLVLGLLLAVTG